MACPVAGPFNFLAIIFRRKERKEEKIMNSEIRGKWWSGIKGRVRKNTEEIKGENGTFSGVGSFIPTFSPSMAIVFYRWAVEIYVHFTMLEKEEG
jgi:hypothetical protein